MKRILLLFVLFLALSCVGFTRAQVDCEAVRDAAYEQALQDGFDPPTANHIAKCAYCACLQSQGELCIE